MRGWERPGQIEAEGNRDWGIGKRDIPRQPWWKISECQKGDKKESDQWYNGREWRRGRRRKKKAIFVVAGRPCRYGPNGFSVLPVQSVWPGGR
jgi:hypothetical protein